MGIGRQRVLRVVGALAILWGISSMAPERVQAQPLGPSWDELTHCTLSGMGMIIVDTECDGEITPGKYYYHFLGYDPITKRLYPFISEPLNGKPTYFPTQFKMTLQEGAGSRLQVLFEPPEGPDIGAQAVLSGYPICGSPGINYMRVTATMGEEDEVNVEAKLVDTTGNRKVDAMLIQMEENVFSSGISGDLARAIVPRANLLIDVPLSYVQFEGKNYWFIPCEIILDGIVIVAEVEIFIPVDEDHNLIIECGDKRAEFPSEAFIDPDGNCLLPVPALTGWGYAGLIFLILASGIWVMRRTGFGRGLSRN